MDNLENLGIAELSHSYISRKTSPTEVVTRTLERIEQLEPKLGAFEVVLADRAMEAAVGAERAIKNGHRIGPFHGVPFVLKDLIHVE